MFFFNFFFKYFFSFSFFENFAFNLCIIKRKGNYRKVATSVYSVFRVAKVKAIVFVAHDTRKVKCRRVLGS